MSHLNEKRAAVFDEWLVSEKQNTKEKKQPQYNNMDGHEN